MTIDKIVHFTAGAMVLLSILLANLIHPYWTALGVMVGLNLVQSAFTSFCPLGAVLKRAGVPAQ